MKDLMLYVDMLVVIVPQICATVVVIATIINQFFPKKISNEKLAKIEAVVSKISIGNKKATVIKK